MCSGFDSEEDKINNGIDIYKHIGEQMKKLIKENENYKTRINKAINYIESKSVIKELMYKERTFDLSDYEGRQLLKILIGDKE